MTTLPLIDLTRLERGPAEAAALRGNLLAATHEWGFFQLTGHGIAPARMTELFDLARSFFALPEQQKLEIEMLKSAHFRGYTRTGGELTGGRVDWREQLDVAAEREPVSGGPAYRRLEGPNQWPSALPQLREHVESWSDSLSALGLRLLHEWAEALGARRDLFDPAFAHDPSTLIKLVRYPGRSDAQPRQGVGGHKDPGVLTLLLIDPAPTPGSGRVSTGLQVEHDGRWIDVDPVPGAFVVNIGELMEVATNGYLKATMHRVVSPPAGSVRLSVPFFLNPALDSNIPVIDLPPELAAAAPGITQDPANLISGVFGDNVLKARLRAHPDVAARHHPDLVR
ncbi:oxidoreductase [Enemella dayhoffiae]|uniref:Oxidoreductase n=1 Tax=Enemella dayhoffiae TaxID=2016507 RepID=A0A255HA04_9ACTN|nr:2-oxoglutarate and iron-dependent oxygenase domain-containing protein [Enemella dayhoffiae]OYO24136.1 oxidoreductase [Enemella dayhoffiae]